MSTLFHPTTTPTLYHSAFAVFQSFQSEPLFRDNRVDDPLATPLSVTEDLSSHAAAQKVYETQAKMLHDRINSTNTICAQHWFLLTEFLALLSLYYRQVTAEDPSYLFATLAAALFYMQVDLTEGGTLDSPFAYQYVGAWLSDTETAQLRDKHNKMAITLQEAESALRAGIRNSHFFTRKLQGQGMSPHEKNAMLRGFLGIKHHIFDSVSLSALLTLKLIEANIPASIERVINLDAAVYELSHSYLILNRHPDTTLTRFSDWNDDAIVLDPRFNIFLFVSDIRKDATFFLKYPQIEPSNKTCVAQVNGNSASSIYCKHLKRFQELLEENTTQTHCLFTRKTVY